MIQPQFPGLFADIMSWIHLKIFEEEQRLAFFAEYNMMQLDCNKRLTKDEIIYIAYLK